ncbi:hypothetical protein PATSB16_34170 [Pandoraea thiooxydans]|nr:hypothetical protein PATSB16_34170 [Pandoraea thiooxydans]
MHFSNLESATRFKNCLGYYFDDAVLTGMKVKRLDRAAS